jgi:hypothetical protein
MAPRRYADYRIQGLTTGSSLTRFNHRFSWIIYWLQDRSGHQDSEHHLMEIMRAFLIHWIELSKPEEADGEGTSGTAEELTFHRKSVRRTQELKLSLQDRNKSKPSYISKLGETFLIKFSYAGSYH